MSDKNQKLLKECRKYLTENGFKYEKGAWRHTIGGYGEVLSQQEQELNRIGGRYFGENAIEACLRLFEEYDVEGAGEILNRYK